MADSTRQVQSRDPFDRFDEAVSDPRLYETYERADLAPYGRMDLAPFESTELTPVDPLSHEPVPLFLSDYEDDRYRDGPDYSFGKQKPLRSPLSISRILMAVAALAAAGGGVALYSMDSTRPATVTTATVNTKASLAGVAPVPFGAAPPEAAQPQPQPQQPRVAAVSPVTPEPPAATTAPDLQAARRSQPGAVASGSPSREEITAAYQSAIKSRVVAVEPATVREAPAAPPPPAAAAPVRRIDPDELAALLKRAKGLLAIGDITAARLLLERAADAQEAEAALMLAGTYDPQVLGVQDMRSVTPDPAMARTWYQKAAQLGSADARRRLSQIQN